MKRSALLLAAMLVAAGCATAKPAANSPWHEVPGFVGGRYIAYPATGAKEGEPVRLLFVLHGMDGDAASYGRLWHQTMRGEYLVVAPQGLMKTRGGRQVSTWDGGAEDLAYLTAVWREVHEQYAIDPSRTVVAGYSAGGRGVALLLDAEADGIAAVVLHASPPNLPPAKVKGKHVMLIAAARDRSFDAERAGAAADLLAHQGAIVDLQVLEGEDHATVYDNVYPAGCWIRARFQARPLPAR